MPIDFSISISVDLDVLVARWEGNIDLCENREGFTAYLRDKDYVLNRSELCDLSRVTTLDADFKRIWSVLTMVNNQAGGAQVSTQCAIYAPADVMFGLARMYQSVAESADGIRVAVFRDQAEALEHLGLPGDTIDGLFDVGTFRSIVPSAG